MIGNKSIKKKIAGGLLALGTALTMAQSANAAETHGKEMVTFGDSFSANGGAQGDRAAASPFLASLPLPPVCKNDNHNWAHQTARNLGYSLADYTCNGTNYTIAAYIEHAVRSGNIGPNTKEVTLMYGGLQPDTYVDTLANATLPNIPKGSNFRGFLAAQFHRIRSAAPNARITMVNYVPMTVNDTLCVIHSNRLKLPLSFPGATRAEEEFNREIGRAAGSLGVNFIDLHNQAKTHDPCQPDTSQRWAVAVRTPTAPSVMPMHPTDVGHTGMAGIITNSLKN
ncbi:GDSL-type esterase/lipase family protein [Corynebacterium macginleyi]|uniref:GDSL-type esterase/lipase family protein n=1 Tax=Corynebacterium macginleyi TaxID=38290 RepID=UPI00190A0154|nr:GDSL-type esterase/lipase family protein [Corynebacterium macginleyi]MBK4147895.1 esterase [Corynebacterium macginleyi]MBK4158037.1 esterase [Corynebacterium macginleyi]MBK4178939.1 esterase [Corynebacterium macginleyi]